MNFKAIIPILSPMLILHEEIKEKEFIRETFQNMIKQLDEEESYKFIINEKQQTVKIHVEEVDAEKLNEDLSMLRIHNILYMDMEIDINEYRDSKIEESIIEKYQYTEEQIIEITIDEIIREFEKAINDFRIAVNIAFPGFFEVGDGEIYADGRSRKTKSAYSYLLESVLSARKRKWPEIKILNIVDTWEWLLKRENFINAMSSNPIERALSAFTHIFKAENYDDLFYSLIGIEAIYTDGKQGILEQLRKKSSAIFGEPENYKNSLSKMYDIRSRFMHGNLNFPSKYYRYDAIEQFDEFIQEEYTQCIEMAESLLVATIQQFVIRNAETLNFNLQTEFL